MHVGLSAVYDLFFNEHYSMSCGKPVDEEDSLPEASTSRLLHCTRCKSDEIAIRSQTTAFCQCAALVLCHVSLSETVLSQRLLPKPISLQVQTHFRKRSTGCRCHRQQGSLSLFRQRFFLVRFTFLSHLSCIESALVLCLIWPWSSCPNQILKEALLLSFNLWNWST